MYSTRGLLVLVLLRLITTCIKNRETQLSSVYYNHISCMETYPNTYRNNDDQFQRKTPPELDRGGSFLLAEAQHCLSGDAYLTKAGT